LTVNTAVQGNSNLTIGGTGQFNSNLYVGEGIRVSGHTQFNSNVVAVGLIRTSSARYIAQWNGGWGASFNAAAGSSGPTTGFWQVGNNVYFGNSNYPNGDYIGDWYMRIDSDYTTTPRLSCRYPGVSYGTDDWIGFGWNNIVGGLASVTIDNGAWYSLANASDARIKQDIAPTKLDCLETVLQLPLVEYRWRDLRNPNRLRKAKAKADAPLKRIGVIAQELNKIFPDIVWAGDSQDDYLGKMWQIDQNNFLALLTGAIQQLEREIESLGGK
jgi:hypothetical protein